MKFVPGKVIDKKLIKGKEVIFRYPKMSDVDGMTEYINKMVNERAPLAIQHKVTKKEEEKYILSFLKEMKKGTKVKICVIVGGKFCGSGDVWKHSNDANRHVAELGIGLDKSMRGMSIGTRLMELLIEHAKKYFHSRILRLDVYGYNKIAQGLYKKMGFRAAGRIPKGVMTKSGRYYDDIIMVKEL